MSKDGWRDVTLGDALTLQRGFDLPSQDRRPGDVSVVSSSGISGRHAEAKVSGPGVVTGRFGTLGTVTYLTEPFWPLNTTLFVRDFKGNDPRFVSFLLQTIDYQAHNDKTTVPGVNRNHLHQTPVRLPGLDEQRRIAAALDALESKISAERALAANLTALAVAIFERSFPLIGADAPGDWPIVRLASFASFARGVSYRTEDLMPADIALVTLKSFGRAGLYQPEGLKSYVGRFRSDQVVEPGDLVIAQTDITQAADVIGRVLRIPRSRRYGKLLASLDAVIVRPMAPERNDFLFGLLARERFRDLARGYANGSTVLHLDGRLFTDYEFRLPPLGLRERFADEVRPLLARAAAAHFEIEVLDEMRAALFPALMSGRLRLSPKGSDQPAAEA